MHMKLKNLDNQDYIGNPEARRMTPCAELNAM